MSRSRLIFEKQWLHALLLGTLLAGLCRSAASKVFLDGELWGVSTQFGSGSRWLCRCPSGLCLVLLANRASCFAAHQSSRW